MTVSGRAWVSPEEGWLEEMFSAGVENENCAASGSAAPSALLVPWGIFT